ncbi:LamG domain-containing protein [Sphingomonas azotifigens]|uniref:LamG domain-containing protein n=1 Tax=Sphingomonas azotifigens TaxID=330920 RepID=UPI000A04E353|nr:LamG domain-containing protein [Sphingomonas azotifigens]
MLNDPRTDRSYVALALDALSSAQTSAAAGALFTATTAVSVDAWIRFNGLPANTVAIGQAGVFAFGSQGPSVYFQFNNLPIVLSDPTQDKLQDDSWHYICMTFDGAMVRLYIDGKFNTGQSCMGQVATSTNPVTIGQGVQGLIRRLRIYNTSLNADTVLNNMFGPPVAGTLAADFDFSVNPAMDRGPSAYPITLQANAAAIKVSPAASLGTVGFIRPMGEKSINPGGGQVDPYTVQTWVFVSSALNPVQALFVNSDLMLDTGVAVYLQYDTTVSAFRAVSQRGSDGDSGQVLTSSGVVQVGVWTNIATTFDGTTLSLYINGVLDSTRACPPIPLYSQFSDLLIGAAIAQGIPSGATTLQGFLREVDVWSTALSAADILTNMNMPPDVTSTNLSAAYVFTNAPARNQANGHPIGLAEGAVLAGQLGPAPVTSPQDLVGEEAPPPPMGLDPEMMAALRAELDFSDLHKRHCADFDDAMARDIEAFDNPKDRALIEAAWMEARRKLAEEPTALPFLVMHHVIDGERLIVVHRPSGSYVAYRADAAAMDDCTMWKVRLIFTIIGGALDAFTGVGSTLGDKAIVLIGRALTIPRVAAQLASGVRMTATGVFTILGVLYSAGLLRPLILLLIDVGFWTLIRVIANMLLIAAGVGTARVIASLAATVVTFVKIYLEKPATCDPLPVVALASLAFDYDPTGASVDGLTIRRNFGTDVPVPEWVPGRVSAKDAPCAYAIASIAGKTPTVQVVVNIPAATTHTVKIQATGGGILGAIDPIAVTFKGTTATLIVPLSNHTLANGGVQLQDVTWTWQYQVDDGSWANMATTRHRVYVILSLPNQPWQQGAVRSNQQLPWTDLLDYACTWARGATTTDLVLSKVTTQVNSGIGLKYDLVAGASFYTGPSAGVSRFLCGLFLDYLTTGGGNGKTVNCTDCATIVTTFSNVLGANVFASMMFNTADPATGFTCNQILAIGYTTWAVPFPHGIGGFSYHEVPWTGLASYSDPLYDACLQYDTGPDPWGTGTHTAGLPVKVPFSTLGASPTPFVPIPTPFTAISYRERLAANTSAGIARCIPYGPNLNTNSGRRPVA